MRNGLEHIDSLGCSSYPMLLSGLSLDLRGARESLDQLDKRIPTIYHMARGAFAVFLVAFKVALEALAGGEAHVNSISIWRPDPVDLGASEADGWGLRRAHHEV